MRQISIVVALLISLFLSLSLSALAAPLPLDQLSTKRSSSGRGTYFYVGEDACGDFDTSNQPIIALSAQIFDLQYCGQWITITNTANEATASGYVHDECQGCGPGDLDMSTSLFQQLGTLDQGVLPIVWSWQSPSS